MLVDSWMALRGYLKREEYFSESVGSSEKKFIPTAICTNLGKILEVYDFGTTLYLNYFFHFLTQVRNSASHHSDHTFFTVDDCLIYMESWLYILKDYKNNLNRNQLKPENIFKVPNSSSYEYMIQDFDGKKNTTFKHRLLLVYLQYFNSSSSGIQPKTKERIRKRIRELFQLASKKDLLNEILNHKNPAFKSDIKISGSIINNKGDEIPWAVPLKKSIAKNLSNNLDIKLDEQSDKEKIFVVNV